MNKTLAKYQAHPIYKDYLDELFSSMNEPVIFEVGCNELQDTYRLSNYFDSARIYGFEPDPDFEFQEIPNVTLTKSAVGSFDGMISLYQSKVASGENPGCSSIRAPHKVLTEFEHIKFPNTISVPIVTLDTFSKYHKIEHVDFIWADIQGAEIDMIRGAQHILQNTDYLFTEYSNDELYSGQASLEQIISELPGRWDIVHDYISDVFLKRVK